MSLTYNQAVEQTITAGEQIHQIVNGTATTEVTVEDGSKVPSIRKALLDNFYFKDPIAWQVGQTENVFNQLRQFTDGSWWYAPSATASNPIFMGNTPIGDALWKIYDFDAIGKLEPRLDEALRRSYADAGYNLVAGSFEVGGTLVNANDVLLHEASGKAFSGPAGTVAAGTNPASGGFVDVSASLNIDPSSVERFGAGPNNTNSENRAALQVAIASADGKGLKILIPPYINYGFERTDKATWPDFSGLSASPFTRIFIEDYSQDNGATLPAREGAQSREWFFTGNQEDGQHNGNFKYIRSGWHPGVFISHDGDRAKMAAGAGVNRRASTIYATDGVANWLEGQGTITDNAATEAELVQYKISANGLPDLGVAGLTTCFTINKTNGAVGFNIGSPRFPFDFVSRTGQPSVGTVSFETPTGEMTLRLGGVSNDLKIIAKPNSGFSVNDASSALLDVSANGGIHTLRRNSAGNATLALKSLTKERRILVRDDTGTLNIQNAALSGNIVIISDTEFVSPLVIRPEVTGVTDIGTAAKSYNNVFASGTIGPSDARLKTAPEQIEDAVLDAWGDVRLVVYQWLDAISIKWVDGARRHFGVIAQQVRDAFLARGVDGTEYGLLCYDEWEDKYEPLLINEGAMVTKTRVVTRPVMVTETHEILVDKALEDGSIVKQALFVDEQVQKTVPVPVFEEDGSPRLDEYGKQINVYERVTETFVEEYQEPAEPEYTQVLVQKAGNRWSIREGQCLFLEAAYQRRRCDRIEKRLAAAGI